MLDAWTESKRSPVNSLSRDVTKLGLNVITDSGCGLPYQSRNTTDDLRENHSMSYGDSLLTVMGTRMSLALVPSWAFDLPILS